MRECKFLRLQQEAVLPVAVQGFPKIERGIMADLRQIDHMAILLGPIPDNRRAIPVVALQIDAEKKTTVRPEIAGVQRGLCGEIVVEQGFSGVERVK